MRPVDVLRFLLVLAEVAGRVEELLRNDRRLEPGVGQRCALAGLVGAAAREPFAHRADVEARELFAVDVADLAAVIRDELHAQILWATSAYVCAVFTRPSISRFSPSSTSISPVDVP